MKKVRLTLLLALASFLSPGLASAQKSTPNEIIGVYWSPKKDARIEIFLKGQQYFGKFIWAANPRKDTKNPSKALQNRYLIGVEFLTGFTYDDGVYDDGEIYDPETGKTYSCKMSLEGTSLKIRGYMGISLFGRTEYFERIK
jgi:uncharacterized protein (DUF2147 family)